MINVKEKPMAAVAEKKPQAASQIVVPDAPYSQRAPVVQEAQATSLVQALATAAADPRTDMDKMERLFAMHQTMVKQQAEAEFNDAMARAQSNIVPIVKDRENSHTKSWYATLAAINDAITPIYSAEGLAVSFDTYSPERDGKDMPLLEKGWHRVIAIVSHRGGHSRKYHLDAPLDDKGAQGTTNKTGIQAMGSTVSYLRRYLVCMIFNVATMDDNDGNRTSGGNGKRMDEKVLADHLAAIDGASDEPELLKTFGKAWNTAEDMKDKDAQRQLIQHRDLRRKALRGQGRRS